MNPGQIARVFCRRPPGIDHWLEPLSDDQVRTIARIAQEHELGALAVFILDQMGQTTALEAETRDRFTNRLMRNRADVRQRRDDLSHLGDHLVAAGVEAILLKEYAFDGSFPDPGVIHQTDLDLLVREQDLESALYALKSAGYARLPRPWPDDIRFGRHGATPIDLHRTGEGGDGLFKRSRPFGHEGIRMLDPTDAVRVLVVHTANHHNYTPFNKIVCCWHYLVHHLDKVDGPRLRTDLQQSGILSMATLSMDYMSELIGWPFPLSDVVGRPSRLRKRIFRALMPPPWRYFEPGVTRQLRRRSRSGLHHRLYLDRLCDAWRLRPTVPMRF